MTLRTILSNLSLMLKLTTKEEETTMGQSTPYVIYTRNFKTRAKQIGVFAEPTRKYLVDGEVNGGKIKYLNLAVRKTGRKTATNKLLSKGLDFTVNVLGTSPRSSALGMKANIISLLKKSGRTVINYSA